MTGLEEIQVVLARCIGQWHTFNHFDFLLLGAVGDHQTVDVPGQDRLE